MSDSKLPEDMAASEIPKKRILHVDDDIGVRHAFKRIIRSVGRSDKLEISLESAESIEKAMDAIKGGFVPDVIFSDMLMVGETGRDFLERLKNEYPALVSRFCFLSAGAHNSQDLGSLLESMREKGRMLDKSDEFDAKNVRGVIRSILESNKG